MTGRLLNGVVTDFTTWRIAIGFLALAAALKPRCLMINFRLHWQDPSLPLLFAEGFLLMGTFVTLFNCIGYRLLGPPYSLSQATVGLLSLVYLTGS